MAQQISRCSIWWQWIFSVSDRRTLPLIISLLLLPVPSLAARAQSIGEIAQTPAASTQDIRQLEQGKPIERQMAAGETHSYQVTVQAGQYLNVAVQQKGVDLVVTLFAPDGKQITEIDEYYAPYLEDLRILTETSGVYRLQLRAFDSSSTPGRYEVKILQLRNATEEDKNIVRADAAQREARQLANQKTPESQTRALAKYEEALQFSRAAGDLAKEAEMLGSIASVYNSLGNFRQAMEYYNQSLSIYRSIDEKIKIAGVLSNISPLYNLFGETQKALDCLTEARTIFKALGEYRGEGSALLNLGWIHYFSLGAQRQALEFYNQALSLYRTAGDRAKEADTLSSLAWAYYGMGENQKALDFYNQAISLAREVKNRSIEAYALLYISQVYGALGQKEQALNALAQSQKIFEDLGEQSEVARTLRHAGGTYWGFGEAQQAIDAYTQSLSIYRSLGNRLEEGYVTQEIGFVYRLQGDNEKALEFLNQSLSIRRAVGERRLEAQTLYDLAVVKRNQGKLKEAVADMESVIGILESIRSKITNQELRTSFFASAQDLYQFYIDLLMQLHKQNPSEGYDAKALQMSERARARSLLELLTEANADIRQGIDPNLLQKERNLQAQLNTVEQQRIKVLSGTHTEAQAKEIETQLLNLQQQYQEIQTEIRAKSPKYAALTQPQPLSLQQIQQQVLDENTLLLEYSLGEERSYLWAVTKNGITSYELPKRADIEAAAKQFRDVITDLLDSQDPAQVAKTAAQLSQIILAPVASQLGEKRLLVVGDGVLQYIPFAALSLPVTNSNTTESTEYKPLIVNHEIVYLPSASTLAISRRELTGRTPAPKAIAMLADPVFTADDERLRTAQAQSNTAGEQISTIQLQRAAGETGINLKRLPFTRQEAEAIMSLIPATEREQSFDFDASRTAATSSQLNQYRIVHFATHGILNPTNPELSGIVMSLVDKDGNTQNGFLRLNDIFNLKLSADMVVLSACKTGSGQNIRGEGIVGLTRGFMYAGSARVIASLWSVNDPATAELMTKFYQRYLKEGLPAAAALRAAQIEMLKQEQWQAPYYWAAFTLQGEWR